MAFSLHLKAKGWLVLIFVGVGLAGRLIQKPVNRDSMEIKPGPVASLFLGQKSGFLGQKSWFTKQENKRPSRTPGPTQISTRTLTISATPLLVERPSATPLALTKNLLAANLSGTTIEVLNGSGAPRVARSLSIVLERFGVRSLKVENADRFNYAQTILRYSRQHARRARFLARAMGLGEDRIFPSSSLPKDVQVSIILGSDHGPIIQHVTDVPWK